MDTQEQLLIEIDAFLARTGMKESMFGYKAVNDGKLIGYLRSGRSITLRRFDQIRAFMRDYEKKVSDECAA